MDLRTRMVALSLLQKEANILTGAVGAGRGFLSSGKHISKVMAEHGVQSPLAHGAAKIAPYALAAAGGKKAYDSQTGQKLRYKYQLWKHRRAQRQAQRQGGY